MLMHTNSVASVRMQSYLTRRSRERRSSGGDFCDVISTLTHDLTKARNQLVRIMHQVSPGGARLYGGYSVPHKPLRTHKPCAGSNVRNRHHSTATPGHVRCSSNAHPHQESARRSCQPMTVYGANRFGQPQQRAPFPCGKSQQKVPKPYEPKSHSKTQYNSCERQQQCNGSDTSDRSYMSERRGQRDATCVIITFDESPEPTPAAHRPQPCHHRTHPCRGSKPACLQESSNPARLQGGGCSRRHDCLGTQFATLLQDVTHQLRVRRIAADLVKTP